MRTILFTCLFLALALSASAQIKFVDELPHLEKTLWVRAIPADTTPCYIITAEGIYEGERITPRFYVVSAAPDYAEVLSEKIIYGPYIFRIDGAAVTPLSWLDKIDPTVLTIRGSHSNGWPYRLN